MSIRAEFRDFIAKGNVIDLAVGVVIGAAFGKIVDSLVSDILMPPLGMVIGGINLEDMRLVLKAAETVDGKEVTPAVSINYGNFIQSCIHFLIIAFSIFIFVVKPVNRMKKKAPDPAPEQPAEEIVLLREIRDSLKR